MWVTFLDVWDQPYDIPAGIPLGDVIGEGALAEVWDNLCREREGCFLTFESWETDDDKEKELEG